MWQFLIDMPFYSLSSKMTWTCYRFLHRGTADRDSFSSLSEYISSYGDQNGKLLSVISCIIVLILYFPSPLEIIKVLYFSFRDYKFARKF